MKAILLHAHGGSENLYLGEADTPKINDHEILVKVHATALNRADILQREGKYPPPPGASEIIGLEMAGEVVKVGKKVTQRQLGDRVCGLLAGGGYAEFMSIHEELALAIPDNLSYTEAAALPEVFLTAFQSVKWIANLQKGETILIHAGASGVGTATIQLAQLFDAEQIIVTVSKGKHETCLQLGAHHAIDYRSENFAEKVNEITNGKGANVVIDFLMASYFQKNLDALAMDGRMVMLATMGGIKMPEVNLFNILRKRLQITGSTLRSRELSYKIDLITAFKQQVWTHFSTGELKPVIDSVFDWKEVGKAHQKMEGNENVGKIVLAVG
ncbi:MAG: tumor protein p53-inducible protein 3 [Paraglaciecola sp.]|jgi:tumor protein p53-inducible protein 3